MNATTMKTYTFTQPEHVVLTHYMAPSALPLDEAARTALGAESWQLAEAEEHLRERRLLVRAPGEDVAVVGELAALLATSMAPDRLVVLRTVLPDAAQPPMYFSFAAERIARNFVDQQGHHVFSSLRDLEEALNAIIVASGAPHEDWTGTNGSTRPLETLVTGMEALAVLTVVDSPTHRKPIVRNLSWLVADGAVWLVDTTDAASHRARLVDRTALRQAVTYVLAV